MRHCLSHSCSSPAALALALALALAAPWARARDAPVEASEEAPAAQAYGPLVEVTLVPSLPGEDPFRRVGLRPGALLDAASARTALRTALASGTFAEARATVRDVPGGVALVITGERRVRVREVVLLGVRDRRLENVQSDLGIAAEAWVSEADVARALERLRQGYRAAGWASVQVASRWRMTDDPGTRLLIVDVTEGAVTRVRRVEVPGVPPELARRVRNASEIRPGDRADPLALRRAFEAIAVELRRAPEDEDGGRYLSAQVDEIRYVPVAGTPANEPRADVVIVMRPGPEYRFEWVGVGRFAPSSIEPALRLQEERSLDVTTLGVLAARVRDFYVRRGFLDARARAEVRPAGSGRAVLRFTVTPGPRVLVRRVGFVGVRRIEPGALEDILRDLLLAELPGGTFLEGPGTGEQAALDGGSGADGPERFRLQPERTYVPELYAEAARRMVAHYREQGYLDTQIHAPEVQRVRDASGRPALDVTFRVAEGPRTLFEEVVFEGNRTVASQTLAERSGLRLGGPVSYAALDAARTQLVDYYREQGYLFARVETEIDRSPDHTVARVRFLVHEGPQVRVGRILFRGSPETRRWVLEERVALRAGELYRPSLVQTTQRQLIELGIFSGVTITPVDPDVEAPVKDVLIQLTELRPYAEVRVGLSTGEGFRLGGDFAWRNIGGTGITFAIGLQVGYQLLPIGDATYQQLFNQLSPLGRMRIRAPLSIQFPAIRGLGPAWRTSIDLAAGRIIERQFAINNAVGGASVLFRPARLFSLTVTPAELQTNELALLGANSIEAVLSSVPREQTGDLYRLSRLLLLPEGVTTLFASRFTAAIDLRDQVFNPQRGAYFALTGEYVATLSFDPRQRTSTPMMGMEAATPEPGNTLRGTASASVYVPVPLPFGNLVLASTVRGGLNYNLDRCKVTYPNRQFFLGGAETMRGWLQDTFIPQDVIDNVAGPPAECGAAPGPSSSGGTPQAALFLTQRGGDAFVLMRNEVRVPVGGSGAVLGLFWDVGNLWKEIRNVLHYVDGATGVARSGLVLRHAAGVGVRYVTPIGPVGLDLGFNLAPYAFELPYAINFSIGNF